MPRAASTTGRVLLVGAGPGDPGLLTLRGLAALREADAVVYDRLVPTVMLGAAPPDAERIYAGKAPGRHALQQEEINRLLVRLARAGKTVVRLKGGDPFVFGRGGEEAEALAAAGIPVEVVPGVTSATAGPAAAGIPVTHRGAAVSVAIATAHEAAPQEATAGPAGSPGGAECAPRSGGDRLDWEALARADTVVLLMGVERLEGAARALIGAGVDPATPAAVVQEATLPGQRTVTAPLASIARAAREAGIRPPAVTIVGTVVGLREILPAWDRRPLAGRRILVTRTREGASELAAILRELGAEAVEAPAIRIAAPRSPRPMERAVAALSAGRYEWVVLTSANGVRALAGALTAAGADARALGGIRVAAVGTGTAEALRRIGIVADLVPETFTTQAVGRAFPRGAGRVLAMRADKGDAALEDTLRAKGWKVERVIAYRLLGAERMAAAVRRAVLAGEIDALTFASAGTVRAFMRLLRGTPPPGTRVVCIGPVTARAAREAGLRVSAVAREHTVPGLAAAVATVLDRPARDRAPSRKGRGARRGIR